MRRVVPSLALVALLLAACGGDDGDAPSSEQRPDPGGGEAAPGAVADARPLPADPDARYIARRGFADAATARVDPGARRVLKVDRWLAPGTPLRALGGYGGARWWVGQGRARDRVCFISKKGTVNTLCMPVRTRYRKPAWLYRALPGRRQLTTVLVPDGYDAVAILEGQIERRSRIRHNLLSLVHGEEILIELGGAASSPALVRIPRVRAG